VFSGEADHGGHAGHRNALLAAEEAVAAASRRIASDHPGVLLRHVLRRAGVMPSITPAEARVWFTTRSLDFGKAREAYETVATAAHDAAGRGGVGFRQQFISESRGYLPNDTLGRVLFDAMQQAGAPDWTESDLAFMEELSRACAPGERMELDRGVHFFDSGEDHYGQDDGEVSWRIPLGRVNWAYPKQVPIHHWGWTALSGHRASHAGPLAASRALAMGAVTLLASPEIIAEARRELAARVEGTTLTDPRIGAMEALTRNPESFWSGSWLA
jgi:aminobenzoyl-glutamate utilization protein B